jgi:hypothetical protein
MVQRVLLEVLVLVLLLGLAAHVADLLRVATVVEHVLIAGTRLTDDVAGQQSTLV